MKSKNNESEKEQELKDKNVEEIQEETPQVEEAADETVETPTEQDEVAVKMDELAAELEEQRDKYLRLAAEYDNFRKRTLKEKSELILNGGEKTLNSILPVVDDFERALSNMEKAADVQAVKEGIDLIYNKFISVLAQNGVKKIETENQPLDTDYHEAIAVVPAPTEEQKGKILDCVQPGYTLNEKVLRHSKVVVGE